MMLKRFISTVLTAVMLVLPCNFVSAASVRYGGYDIDVNAVIINGVSLSPLRDVFETFGASVEWNADTQTAVASIGEYKVSVTVGSNVITANGVQKDMGCTAQIIEGKTYIPLRAAAEAFGHSVGFDAETQTVIIEAAELPWTLGEVFDAIIRQCGWEDMLVSMSIGDCVNVDGFECAVVSAYADGEKLGDFAVSYDLKAFFEVTETENIPMNLQR